MGASVSSAATFLRQLCRPGGESITDVPVLVVAAHPDDETIGAGPRLARLRAVQVVFVTDGAPADLRDVARLGFASRAAYASARAREADTALSLLGIDPA